MDEQQELYTEEELELLRSSRETRATVETKGFEHFIRAYRRANPSDEDASVRFVVKWRDFINTVVLQRMDWSTGENFARLLIEPSGYLTNDIDYVDELERLVSWMKSKLSRKF